MSLIKTLLARTGLAERRQDQRMNAQGLTVSYAGSSEQKKARIGNISPTGLYLVTGERWPTGTTVVLTLGEKSKFDQSTRSQVKLWTRCVRVDEAGSGLTFTHAHISPVKWLEAMSKAPAMIAENHPVHVFRFTRALAFLFSISPASESQVLKLINGTLTREAIERAIEIALLADDLLESQSRASRTDVPPHVILRILEQAAEVEQPEVRDSWARLLAASSLSGSQDELNLSFATLLARMNPFHLRILAAAGRQAGPAVREAGSDQGISCSVEEVQETAGLAVREEVESIVNDLHEYGLLGSTDRPPLFGRLARVNLTLSGLGLSFCERCCEQSQPVHEDSPHNSPLQQYVPVEIDCSSLDMSNSLASEAQTIRQSSGFAAID